MVARLDGYQAHEPELFKQVRTSRLTEQVLPALPSIGEDSILGSTV